MSSLRIRWLGRTRYRDSYALQRALVGSPHDWLLLQEHDHVYTLGVRTDRSNLLGSALTSGAEIETVDRGGDVTYHGPGQLVGYPVVTIPGHNGGSLPDTPGYVMRLQNLIIDAVASLGGPVLGAKEGYPGVWFDPEGPQAAKVAAVGVRIQATTGVDDQRLQRSLHGFAINLNPDLTMFDHIVPCGISEFPVTSLRRLGMDVSMSSLVDAVAQRAAESLSFDAGHRDVDRADVLFRTAPGDLAPFSGGHRAGTRPDAGPSEGPGEATPRHLRAREAGGITDTVPYRSRKPEFLRAKVEHSPAVTELRSRIHAAGLVTVCEEAGCPNLSECWSEGTATFMINGDRCTRACGFCLVDTRRPFAPDPGEAERIAASVVAMDLAHAVITTVARDDLADGGAAGFVSVINAVRAASPMTRIEVLTSDCKGDPHALASIFEARPDVFNHNLETVARLQRIARPSAGYARSLAVLGRAAAAGLVTKSGLVLGMGETKAEISQALGDLAAVGVSIVTMGQYLRPSRDHLPIANYWTPEDFAEFAEMAQRAGIVHAESSPFTRSSHHAGTAYDALVEIPVSIGSTTVR